MEKVKTFLKANYIRIAFGAFFILLLGFLALPVLNYTFKIKVDGVKTYPFIPLSFYQVMAGGSFERNLELRADAFIIVTFIFILIGAICFVTSWFIKKDNQRSNLVGVAFGLFVLSIFLLVGSNKFLATYDYLGSIENFSKININPLGFSLVMVCLSILSLLMLSTILKELKFETREIAEIGMFVAVALVLDKLKLWVAGPSGGSVNLAGITLLLIALRYGPLKTFITSSIIFGLLSCLIDGYGFQTYPFDYLIAFSGYMVTAFAYKLFKATVLRNNENQNKELGFMITSLVIGCVSVMVTRMIGSSISSYLYFLDWLDSSWLEATNNNQVLAIMLYNISYIGPSAVLSLIAAIILAKPMQMLNHRYPTTKQEKIVNAD